MEQVDGSRMKAAFQLLQCLGRLRLILGVIVQVCKAPEYAFVIAVVDNGQGLLAEDPGRKAEQMHFVVEILLHICVELRDLPLLLFHGLGRQSVSRMGDAVGAHSVPLVDHALDQIRILLDIGGGHKKYGLDIFFLQDIQNIGGSAVFIALVKGQVDFIAVRDNEIGIVFAVFFLVGQGGAGPVLLVAVCAGPPALRGGIQGSKVNGRIGHGVGGADWQRPGCVALCGRLGSCAAVWCRSAAAGLPGNTSRKRNCRQGGGQGAGRDKDPSGRRDAAARRGLGGCYGGGLAPWKDLIQHAGKNMDDQHQGSQEGDTGDSLQQAVAAFSFFLRGCCHCLSFLYILIPVGNDPDGCLQRGL